MSRRIDIELTSDRGDGTWTWRAAGAKQPKGDLRADLLPAGATVGQELRAEIEATLDGTEVVAVLPPKEKNRAKVETIELIGRPVRDEELVTSKLAGKGGRDRRDRDDRGDRRDRRDRSGGQNRDRRERTGGDRPRRDGGARGEGRPDRPRRDRPAPPPKPKPKRLKAGRTHRKAALEALPAAEQVIAEQVLMGGLPAVRQAVAKQNEQARATGGREVAADPLLAIAERLLPDLRAAEWRDKAEAAIADLDELDLRDLRSVVVAADNGAKDEESRALADQLRAGLARRVEDEQAKWVAELRETLAEGRVVRALRLSSRPPKAGAPLPPEVAQALTEAASAALTADTLPDRWATVLDALSFSPVRLAVIPASKPDAPSEELVAIVTRMADRVPKVAEAFGIDPATVPARKGRGRSGGAKAPKGSKGSKPPKPPKPPKPEATTEGSPSPASSAAAVDAEAEPTAPAEATQAPSEEAAAPEPAAPADAAPPVDAAPAASTPEPEAPPAADGAARDEAHGDEATAEDEPTA